MGALNQRSTLLRISSLPTSSTSTAGISVIPSSTATSFARKWANGSERRFSTNSLMMLRASTNTSPTRIVRFVADSAYSTNSVRKSGARVAERLASASRLTRAATSTTMPVRISLVLSRNGRRGAGAGLGVGGAAGLGCGLVCRSVNAIVPRGPERLRSILCIQQILQLRHELPDVAEVPVDRGESYVRHLVEPLQLVHDHGSDLFRAHLLFGAFLQR